MWDRVTFLEKCELRQGDIIHTYVGKERVGAILDNLQNTDEFLHKADDEF